MQMPGRKYSAGNSYRYGFNGKENDNEVKGQGNQQDYGMRIYDPRLGRFLSEDPIAMEYPELTPYQFASNTPIWAIDIDGLEAGLYGSGVTLSTAEKIVTVENPIVTWWNAPASNSSKQSLANQINYSQNGVNLDYTSFNGMTNGERLITSLGVAQLNRNQPGRLHIPNTRQPQTPKASVPNKIGTVKIAHTNNKSVETVTVTRVQTQHKLSKRISVNEAGDISITGKKKLYITIDDKNHVQYYYNKKGGSEGGASVVSFQVNKDVADEIRKMAVPQAKARSNPNNPEIADPTQSKSAFGLPANYIEKLEKGAIKGTGKVETP